ncbi:MAG TPA: ABC transporter substrate-binding protein [Chloroflexota bacterium]|nr:ABC transporter substrate-binding protein [Chloroflexota bacterium]
MTKALALIFGLSVVLAGCGGAAASNSGQSIRHVTLLLDWYPNSDHGGVYAAIQRGYLGARHVDLKPEVPSNTSAQIPLVAAGRAEFAITYEADLLNAQTRHLPVRSVMCVVQHPLNTVMSLKNSGITRPRDLDGKTVGIAGVPSDRVTIQALVRHDGGSFSSVHLENVGYNLLAVLEAKRVDAVEGVYWTWEAIKARQAGYPVNVMRVERWGVPNYCELVVITNTKTIRDNPGLVRDTVQALQQGYAFAASHPARAWEALYAADKALHRKLVLASLKLLAPLETDARTVGYQDPAQWKHYAAWLWANRLIPARVNATTAFTNEFLKPGIK